MLLSSSWPPSPPSPSPSSLGTLSPGNACFFLLYSWHFTQSLCDFLKIIKSFCLTLDSQAHPPKDFWFGRSPEWVLFEGVQTWTLIKYWKCNVIEVVDLVLVFLFYIPRNWGQRKLNPTQKTQNQVIFRGRTTITSLVWWNVKLQTSMKKCQIKRTL